MDKFTYLKKAIITSMRGPKNFIIEGALLYSAISILIYSLYGGNKAVRIKAAFAETYIFKKYIIEYIMLRRSIENRWPEKIRLDMITEIGPDALTIKDIIVKPSSFTFIYKEGRFFKERDRQLTYRASWHRNNPDQIRWLCGYRASPNNYITNGINLTNIPNEILPEDCKEK